MKECTMENVDTIKKEIQTLQEKLNLLVTQDYAKNYDQVLHLSQKLDELLNRWSDQIYGRIAV